ncbi:MAG TPA: NUDIX hydrolase [Nocardioidaceae bacterium]|nr:NUDIX hydrolase [Nocardioidaceae bacterium]
MTQDRWTRVGDDVVVHDGWLRVVRRRYRMPDGSESDWELLGGFESVSVLALTEADEVVLVRQFRPGPDALMLNLPGGLVDPGESPTSAAARELTEETGWVAGSVDVVASFHPMAHGGWVKHIAIARGCTPTGVQSLDEVEDCVPVLVTPTELRAQARAGALVGTDAVYVALDHAGLL